MFHLQVRVDLVSKRKLFCWYFTRTSLKAKSQCFDNETFRSKYPVLKVEMEARRGNLSHLRVADMQIRGTMN